MRLQLTVEAIFAAIFNMVQIFLASFELIGFEREERNLSGGGGLSFRVRCCFLYGKLAY